MRRGHERFSAEKGLCAGFSTNCAPNISRLAEIADISRGGLAIVYKSRRELSRGLAGVAILAPDGSCAATDALPCRVVYDHEITRRRGLCGIPPVRRCGIEFGELTAGQARLVESVIEKHSVKNGPGLQGLPKPAAAEIASASPGC